jgi:hypothetical protein
MAKDFVNDWPELLTPKESATKLRTSESTVRNLRSSGRLGYVKVAGRYMHTADHLRDFIEQNSVEANRCHDTTEAPICTSSGTAAATTSGGASGGAQDNVRRVQAICEKLKHSSPTSSQAEEQQSPAPVIRPNFR